MFCKRIVRPKSKDSNLRPEVANKNIALGFLPSGVPIPAWKSRFEVIYAPKGQSQG